MMYGGIFLLSTATLALEIALTRFFSLTQWYHFAFMAIAVALLGFGASGSFLAVAGPGNGRRRAALAGAGFVVATLAIYPATNLIPFDAYRLAIEPRQIAYLMIYVIALAAPFFCSGLALGALLSAFPAQSGFLYGANLAGSGVGCLFALGALPMVGAEGMPFLAASLGTLAVAAFAWGVVGSIPPGATSRPLGWAKPSLVGGSLGAAALLLTLAGSPPPPFTVRLSPYKALSVVSAFQGSRHTMSRWNAFSRVDVVEGPAIHSAPGLSLAFTGTLPLQPALTVDGDNLQTIPTIPPDVPAAAYADYLPTAVALFLRPAGRVLVVQAGAGLDVLVALRQKAHSVVAVEANPLMIEMARAAGAHAIYGDPRVQVVIDNGRSFLARSKERFDIIIISLTEGFRAVTAGDFSLSENYIYTREAFRSYYEHLAPGGLLVVTRWAQWPPSEDLRVAALAAATLRDLGGANPPAQVVAFRSFQTVTILVRRHPFTDDEIATLRRLWDQRAYDPVYYPGMRPEDANRFIILPDTRHYDAYVSLLREGMIPSGPFDVTPPRDDHPFFFHFFQWGQVDIILRNLGKTWQPFGGAGYLVLVALLAVAIIASLVLILVPVLLQRLISHRGEGRREVRGRASVFAGHLRLKGFPHVRFFVYFALLGLGFLFVEIPLLQRYILYLGQPIYATSVVLFSLLVTSGLSSLASVRLQRQGCWSTGVIALLALAYPPMLSILFAVTLGLPLAARLGIAILSLAPLGLLMGIPFPWGLRVAEQWIPGFVPWAWAVNGCASVVSSVLAALVAVSWGFSWVLVGAALAYGIAWGVSVGEGWRPPGSSGSG